MNRSTRLVAIKVALTLLVAMLGAAPAVADEHPDDGLRPDECSFQMVGAPALPGASGVIADEDARTAWQFLLLNCPEEPELEVLQWNVSWFERVRGVGDTGVGGPDSVGEGVPEEDPMANYHGTFPTPEGQSALWDVMIPNLSTYRISVCAWYWLEGDPEPEEPFEPDDRRHRIRCWSWGQWH